jgi:uncharacterized protein (TIGR02453 family)
MKATAKVDLEPVVAFLRDLARNNNKAWFEENRPRYVEARARFEDLVAYLVHGIDAFHRMGMLAPKDYIYRINRDVRFSHDKSPYKTNFAAYIAPGGRKATALGYYLHIAPGNQSMLAGGMYMPEGKQLANFRKAIAIKPGPFKKIITAPAFKKAFGSVAGEKLVTAPQGYDRAHPEIELLRLKQVLVSRTYTDNQVIGGDLQRDALATFKTMKPFLDYLNGLPR